MGLRQKNAHLKVQDEDHTNNHQDQVLRLTRPRKRCLPYWVLPSGLHNTDNNADKLVTCTSLAGNEIGVATFLTCARA